MPERAATPVQARGPATSEAVERLLYLYAVLPEDADLARTLAAGRIAGLDPAEPVTPLTAAGLIAAVSRVPAATFAEKPLNALVTDLPRLAPYAVAHEAAIRALSALAPAVIPMAFGAVYRSEERVRALLAERGDELRRTLAALWGREEWGLKVFADTARLLAAVDARSEALRALADQAATATPGRAYLLNRQRERLQVAEAERLTLAALSEILAALARQSVEVRRETPAAPATSGNPQLVLKAALLVERENAQRLSAIAAAQVERHTPHGLTVELTGPWAPYSFVGGRDGGA